MLVATKTMWVAGTTTTVSYFHKGAVLPFARVVVIAVPTVILLGFMWLAARRRDKSQ